VALIRKILVPIDFSPCSTAALYYAAALADEMASYVDVMHVRQTEDVKIGSSAPMGADAVEEGEQLVARALDRVRGVLAERLSYQTIEGDPVKAIVETAGSGGYDLVVMGTHGRVGRLHMLVGSVAEAVVRNAPCPVLTVRVGAGEEESFADRLRGGGSLADQAQRS
jgi:nucleotide-binding universal stress UspA family protein